MLAEIQARFTQALRSSENLPPDDVCAVSGDRPMARFSIYRNNVRQGLAQAVASRFPVGVALVGDEFFHAMARAYVDVSPPQSPVLLTYGDDFPDFVARFEPARELFYLADVLRLEVARARSYHARDEAALSPDLFAAIEPDRMPGLRVAFHPAARLVRSAHPVVTIWSMNNGLIPLGPVENWTGEDALITRPKLDVLVHRLPEGGAAFLASLIAGNTLADAADAAFACAPGFDLGLALATLVTSGACTALL